MSKFTDAVRDAIKNKFKDHDVPVGKDFEDWIQAIQDGIEQHEHKATGGADSGTGDAAALTAEGVGAVSESDFSAHEDATGNEAHVPATGTSGQFLAHDGTWQTPSIVAGPESSTNHALSRWDGTGGDALLDTGIIVDDNNVLNMADNTLRRPVIKDYGETRASATSGATHTIDLEDGNVHEITLDNNCTFAFSNPPAAGTAGSFTLILKQDSSGSRTPTWPASVHWPGGEEPVLSEDGDSVDILVFVTTDGGTTWYGMLAGLGFEAVGS